MAYWLLNLNRAIGLDDQCARQKGEHWDGVRNFLANKQMKNMKLGDKVLSSVNEKRIMGTVEVIKEHYPDHTDESGLIGMVDIVARDS